MIYWMEDLGTDVTGVHSRKVRPEAFAKIGFDLIDAPTLTHL